MSTPEHCCAQESSQRTSASEDTKGAAGAGERWGSNQVWFLSHIVFSFSKIVSAPSWNNYLEQLKMSLETGVRLPAQRQPYTQTQARAEEAEKATTQAQHASVKEHSRPHTTQGSHQRPSKARPSTAASSSTKKTARVTDEVSRPGHARDLTKQSSPPSPAVFAIGPVLTVDGPRQEIRDDPSAVKQGAKPSGRRQQASSVPNSQQLSVSHSKDSIAEYSDDFDEGDLV